MSGHVRDTDVQIVDELQERLCRDLSETLGLPVETVVERVTDRGTDVRVRFSVHPRADAVAGRLREADPEFYAGLELEPRGQFDVRCTLTRRPANGER